MNRIFFLSVLVIAGITISHSANAQLWNRIKNKVKNTAENHVVNDAGSVTDKAIDKTENAAAKAISGNGNNQNAGKNTNTAPPAQTTAPAPTPAASATVSQSTPTAPTMANYKNYDFVPGDKVIFESDLKNQKDAELPARLGTLRGNVEIQTNNGKKVIHLDKGDDTKIIPLIDSANYLPNQFTVEFDLLYDAKDPGTYNIFQVNFYKPDKNKGYITANRGVYYFSIYEAYRITLGKSISGQELPAALIKSLTAPLTWHHIAIYVRKNISKVYIDQYRVGASNTMPAGVTKMSISTDGSIDYLIKNFRIAAGGSDAYHKIMTEGKLITHGIHFASGSADILPESMGTINEVYDILKNHAALKFEIDGHTDSDGSADLNLKLSQQRADAVKAQLVKMGVDASRLTTKGFGETKPVGPNDTPEGKANNRRVEFVKK